MPANKTSFYKNGLTKLEVYEIKENIKALESWLQAFIFSLISYTSNLVNPFL
jgi:hypothetical protein